MQEGRDPEVSPLPLPANAQGYSAASFAFFSAVMRLALRVTKKRQTSTTTPRTMSKIQTELMMASAPKTCLVYTSICV